MFAKSNLIDIMNEILLDFDLSLNEEYDLVAKKGNIEAVISRYREYGNPDKKRIRIKTDMLDADIYKGEKDWNKVNELYWAGVTIVISNY